MIPQSLPNAPYMLEEIVKSVSEESSSSVKLQLLSAVMKLFFKRPPECQEMLGTLLEHSIGKLLSFPPPNQIHVHLRVHVCVHSLTVFVRLSAVPEWVDFPTCTSYS